MIFPPISYFIMLLLSFEYPHLSNFGFTSPLVFGKNFLSRFHTQIFLVPYGTDLPFFLYLGLHVVNSYIRISPWSNIACPRNTGLYILISVYPISTANNSFENLYPSSKFGFITYLACFFFWLPNSFMPIRFLIFAVVFPAGVMITT